MDLSKQLEEVGGGNQNSLPRSGLLISQSWMVQSSLQISESLLAELKLSTVARPSMWVLISMIQKEESTARAKVDAISSGKYNDSNPGRSKRRQERADKLRELMQSYNTMTTVDLLMSVLPSTTSSAIDQCYGLSCCHHLLPGKPMICI